MNHRNRDAATLDGLNQHALKLFAKLKRWRDARRIVVPVAVPVYALECAGIISIIGEEGPGRVAVRITSDGRALMDRAA